MIGQERVRVRVRVRDSSVTIMQKRSNVLFDNLITAIEKTRFNIFIGYLSAI